MTHHLSDVIKAHVYRALQDGPHLLVLGGVHGDETCGSVAALDICACLNRGEIRLVRGALTVIPVCNPQAQILMQRQVDMNLNRVFQHHDNPTCYEHRLANNLVPYVQSCDYLLDLHSYGVEECGPFVFQDYDSAADHEFAQMIGIPTIVTGWPDIYGPLSAQEYQGDSVACVHAHGKIGVVVECGQHQSLQSPIIADGCIRRALAGLALCEQTTLFPVSLDLPIAPTNRLIRACQMIRKTKEGSFSRPWKNFRSVSVSTVIAQYEDGEELIAQRMD